MRSTQSSVLVSNLAGSSAVIRRASVFVVVMAVTVPGFATAQITPLPVGPTDSATIAMVEAEGAAHPRASHMPPYPAYFLQDRIENQDRFGPPPKEIGSSARKCVAVPPGGAMRHWDNRIWVPTAYMRSGEFMVSAGREMVHGQGQKLPWTPAWPTRGMELLVRARRLSAPTEAFQVTITDAFYTGATDDEPRPWEAAFPTRIVFPSAGTWVVVGTSGSNWGCLVYTVG